MKDNVFKTIEITGVSSDCIEDAVRNAISRTAQSVHNMKWFEISQIRGALDSNHVAQWQVSLKISFEVDE